MKRIGFVCAGIIVFLSLIIPGVFAEPTAEQWGAIMNIAGRQRMLSQKMSKEALLVAAKINPEENRKALAETMLLFEKSLKGLIEGDASLNLPLCEFPDIVGQLERVSLIFSEMDGILDKTVEGSSLDINDMRQIAKASLPLLTSADKAVQMFNEEAKRILSKDPTLATTINIAGRQRMLSQKMAKESLLLYLKVDVDVQAASLGKTAALFEQSLKGLKFGDNDLGLMPLKQDDIKAQIEVVESSWIILKPMLENIVATYLTHVIGAEEIKKIGELTSTLLAESNKAVAMYEKLAQ